MISSLPIILLFGLVQGCARTSDSGTATTTVATVTTTAGTGTTTTGADCSSCTPAQLTLSAEPDGGPQSHAPDTPTAGQPLNGCATLMITCTPMAGEALSLMTFDNGIGGPAAGNPATATLVCNTQGMYQLEDMNGPTITAVYCLG